VGDARLPRVRTSPSKDGSIVKRIATLAAVAAALTAAVLPATAGAAPKEPQAQILGTVQINGTSSALVTARYTCPEGVHLWVSAKQSADGSRDPRLTQEGSSAFSAAWLQNHPTAFTCDGTWRTGTFQVDLSEYGFGALRKGQAWVQFCLIGESTFLSESRWVAVR